MADLRVAADFLKLRLLKYLNVEITGARFEDRCVILTVEGLDVPEGSAELRAVFTERQVDIHLEPIPERK